MLDPVLISIGEVEMIMKAVASLGVVICLVGCSKPTEKKADWEAVSSIVGSTAPLNEKITQLEKVGLKCTESGQNYVCTDLKALGGRVSSRTIQVSANGDYGINISNSPSH